jgi:hypothetical protein
MRWRQCNNAMVTIYDSTFALSPSRYRFVAIAFSHCRHRIIALSHYRTVIIALSHCRHRIIVIALSYCRHRPVALWPSGLYSVLYDRIWGINFAFVNIYLSSFLCLSFYTENV